MQHLSRHAIADMLAAAVALALVDPAAPVAPPRARNVDPRPFAKRDAGRDRRAMRRQVRAAKSAWLNS